MAETEQNIHKKVTAAAGGPRRGGRGGRGRARGRARGKISTGKTPANNFTDRHIELIEEATSSFHDRAGQRAPAVVDDKAANAANGLETSTFTVCTRIRPRLPMDGAENSACVCIVPGSVTPSGESSEGYTEDCMAILPGVSVRGEAEVKMRAFGLDYTFGPENGATDIFDSIGRPLAARALAGQVGVVFAYGQTGSGKTHTMGALLENLGQYIFEQAVGREVRFSYMEILGQDCLDCLGEAGAKVRIGELLDGRVVARDLSEHLVTHADHLASLISVAKSRRATEATDRNAQSSRSHGVGIIRISHAGFAPDCGPAAGLLYVIDLAGSERAADSKGHSRERMKETQAINTSLMSLKECIRARTLASRPGAAAKAVHVPYRRSKLTLLMKDVFDIGCARLCATVVLAHVSPTGRDLRHSLNTLKYAAPLRVATSGPSPTLQRDERDPALWSSEQTAAWISSVTGEQLDPAVVLLPGSDGMVLCRTPEVEVYRRVMEGHSDDSDDVKSELARLVYTELWTLICDAKTRKRRGDGTIVSEEEEAAAAARAEVELQAKSDLWKEREKHLAA